MALTAASAVDVHGAADFMEGTAAEVHGAVAFAADTLGAGVRSLGHLLAAAGMAITAVMAVAITDVAGVVIEGVGMGADGVSASASAGIIPGTGEVTIPDITIMGITLTPITTHITIPTTGMILTTTVLTPLLLMAIIEGAWPHTIAGAGTVTDTGMLLDGAITRRRGLRIITRLRAWRPVMVNGTTSVIIDDRSSR